MSDENRLRALELGVVGEGIFRILTNHSLWDEDKYGVLFSGNGYNQTLERIGRIVIEALDRAASTHYTPSPMSGENERTAFDCATAGDEVCGILVNHGLWDEDKWGAIFSGKNGYEKIARAIVEGLDKAAALEKAKSPAQGRSFVGRFGETDFGPHK